ncbi:MAG: homoserine kinase [Firmicutes bacterium]|nr:homoserine kinase [Bacillota bacterium]
MITVKASASTANLGPGFDCLGMALKIYNTAQMEEAETTTIKIHGEGEESLPKDSSNLVYKAAEKIYSSQGKKLKGLKVILQNDIPLERGLGSSAAAILCGMGGANKLLGSPISWEELLPLACRMEGHPDNIMASIMGGFVVVSMKDSEPIIMSTNVSSELKIILAVPDIKIKTEDARNILPETVPFKDAVFNLSRTALLVTSFFSKKWAVLAEATDDKLHQPYRMKLVPSMADVMKAARKAGALGSFISGSGSAVGAFAVKREQQIEKAMKETFAAAGIKCSTFVTEVENNGIQDLQNN